MVRKFLFALPFLVFIPLVAWFIFGLSRDASILPSALINKEVPRTVLPSLFEGEKGLSPDIYKDKKVTLVNIWASWCVPCRIEHPFLEILSQEKDTQLIGFNWKDSEENALDFLDENGNIYHIVGVDYEGNKAIDWGVYGVPETYFIDKKGIIRYKHTGPILEQHLQDLKNIIKMIRQS